MKTLSLSRGSFDRDNTFRMSEIPYSYCMLFSGKITEDDGQLWVMLMPSVISNHKSVAENTERARLNSGDWTVKNGERVMVDGKEYLVKYLGNYSTCADLIPA